MVSFKSLKLIFLNQLLSMSNEMYEHTFFCKSNFRNSNIEIQKLLGNMLTHYLAQS